MGRINRDITNMQEIINGTCTYSDPDILLDFAKDDVELAYESGLKKYAEYLKDLYQRALQTYKNEYRPRRATLRRRSNKLHPR